LIEALHQLSSLAMRAKPGASEVSEACHVIRQALNASDAYVVRSGDPSFVRIGCDCPPNEYEIKQKGYFLIWREAIAHPEFAAGLFDVVDRIVSPGTPIAPGHPCTHLATLLPGDESNSELLVVRGPWPQGLSREAVRFVDVARPLVAHLVNNALDGERDRRQRVQLEAMADIARAFSEARGTENVLEALATALAKASGFDWVTMSVYDEECRRTVERAINVARHSATETAGVWRDGRSIQQVTSDAGGSELFGVQLARIGPILLPDVFDTSQDSDARLASFVPVLPGLRKYWERAHILSVGMFPILFQERVIGEISFSSSTPRTFDRDEVDFLRALVVQAATTIKGLRLFGELERSRLELQRSEERFRSLVQHASDLVTVIQADTTVTYQSPAIEQVLGRQPEQIISRRLIELVHADDRVAVARALEKLMVEPAGTVAGEGRFLHRNGQWRHLEFVGSDQRENPAIEGLAGC